MIMPLLAPAAGVLRPQMLGGALIKAGDLIARLDLDNPAAQAQASHRVMHSRIAQSTSVQRTALASHAGWSTHQGWRPHCTPRLGQPWCPGSGMPSHSRIEACMACVNAHLNAQQGELSCCHCWPHTLDILWHCTNDSSHSVSARSQCDKSSPCSCVQAQPFTGSFPELGPPVVYSEGVEHVFKSAQTAATMIMAGECCAAVLIRDVLLCASCKQLSCSMCNHATAAVPSGLFETHCAR